jgi:hypothetical protein
MTAPVKLAWHKPKIVTVETVGPLRCCKMFTLYDGRVIVVPGNPPIVTEALSTEAWVKAIAEIIRPLPLRYHDFYSSELLRHAELAQGSLWSLIADMDNIRFGRVLREIAISGKSVDGCTLRQIPGDRKRARWRAVFAKT